MKEKLIIKNFGPIRHVEMELGRFNVLIGEQATGKSTVAKLLAVCRYFSYIAGIEIKEADPRDSEFQKGLSAWGLQEFIRENSYISYESKHYTFTAENRPHLTGDRDTDRKTFAEYNEFHFSTSLISKSHQFTGLLAELGKIKPKQFNSDNSIGEPEVVYYNPEIFSWTVPTSFYQNEVARVMDNPFFLPAERGLQSIFSLGRSSIQNLSDALFNQLAKIDNVTRLFKTETPIEPLDITYKNINGSGYVRKNKEGNFFSLFNAATGYQSLIPVVLLTRYYSEIKKKAKTFILEEPELNLFPTAQQSTVQFLVGQMVNNSHSFLLTTHSPYILTSINNLIYAYEVGQSQGKEVEEIIPREYWLNKDEFSAYMMLPDGTCENIMDEEMSLIKVEKIDDISDKLSKDWHKLAELEFSKEK